MILRLFFDGKGGMTYHPGSMQQTTLPNGYPVYLKHPDSRTPLEQQTYDSQSPNSATPLATKSCPQS